MAKKLYHDYAKALPIIDYHNHLSPEQIAKDIKFENITQVWLSGDHYKWRAMRAFGIDEHYITGKASDKEKFFKWAEVVPYTVRNPLFHWNQLELQRYFDIQKMLSPDTAEEIWNKTSDILAQKSHSTNGLLKQMNVEVLCTTDDPTDDLAFHKTIAGNNHLVKTLPTFRPDKAYAVENPENYNSYLKKLETSVGFEIATHEELMRALKQRIDYFADLGCRLCDHGLEKFFEIHENDFDIEHLFQKIKSERNLEEKEIEFFKIQTFLKLSKHYHGKGWVQQFHVGAIRDNNKRLLDRLGPDTGFDSIGDFSQARAMSQFFNRLDSDDQLAKTIVYNLNPVDNEVVATMVDNFNNGSVKGKMQYGSAWWFLDQKDGMEK